MPVTPITDQQERDVKEWERQVGTNVRMRRKRRGLTQEDLAELAHCDRQTINRLENAAYTPMVDRLYWVARALGCNPADLLPPPVPGATGPDPLPQRRPARPVRGMVVARTSA